MKGPTYIVSKKVRGVFKMGAKQEFWRLKKINQIPT